MGYIRSSLVLLLPAALLAGRPTVWTLSFGAGPIVGAEFGNASIGNHDQTSGRTGFAAGLRSEFGVTNPWSLLVEPQYVQKGASFEEFGVTAKGELDYLEIPVLVKAKFGALKAHVYAFAGPSLGINLNAKGEFVSFTGFSGDFKDQASSLVFSGDIGVGGTYQVARFTYLNADIRYSHGFTDALKKSIADIDGWKSRDIRLLVCLLFHLTE